MSKPIKISHEKKLAAYVDSRSTFDAYVKTCCATEVMTREEERAAFARMHAGDTTARDELILANQKFVLHVAKFYVGRGVPLDDLIMAGNLGLIEAVDKFDMASDAKLVSYAVWSIRSRMQREIMATGHPTTCQKNFYNTYKRIREEHDRMLAAGTHEPTAEELAARTGASPASALCYLVRCKPAVSLHRPISQTQPDGPAMIDVIEDGHDLDAEITDGMTSEMVSRMLGDLTAREADIMRRAFGIDGGTAQTLETIGRDYKLSRERIRQIKEGVFSKVRDKRQFAYVREAMRGEMGVGA